MKLVTEQSMLCSELRSEEQGEKNKAFSKQLIKEQSTDLHTIKQRIA